MSEVMEEVHLTTIKPKNHVLLLAQEISFAKVLACNDKRLRDRGIRRLKKWFMARSQGSMDFTKDDHLRIWKGLFYCMWMADKPLVQEELAEEISHLIHSFATFEASLLFVETFFSSLSIEWFGIDQLRLDKFMMLVRRFIRQSLELMAKIGWPEDEVQLLVEVYFKALISAPMGLSMHMIEVFCEELAKVGKGELQSEIVLRFVTMFVRLLSRLNDGRMISQITRCVFLHLIRQTELGIEHQMKFSAWKEFGFPGGDIDAAEKVEKESSEDEEEELKEMSDDDGEWEDERKVGMDARAGKVDVLLPPLDFNPRDLLVVLREHRNNPETTTKARKTLIQLINKYENLAVGKYPLGVHKVNLPVKTDKKKEIEKAAKRLCNEDENLVDHENSPSKKLNDKKTKKCKSVTTWEVSEVEGNTSNNDSVCGKSPEGLWQVSDSVRKSELTTSDKRKRNENNALNSTPCNAKKVKKCPNPEKNVSDCKHEQIKVTKEVENSNKEKNSSVDLSVTKKANAGKEKRKIGKKELSSERGISKKSKEKTHSLTTIASDSSNNSKSKNKENKCTGGLRLNHPIAMGGPDNSNSKSNGKKCNSEIKLDASATENNNGWGGDWDEPLKPGEYEMFIPNKRYVKKRKSMGLSHPVSSFTQGQEDNMTPKNIKNISKTSTPSSSQKKVGFNLSANCSQDFKDYKRKLRLNKKDVPFDASKKPPCGLLKNSTPSPINPFYKRKIKFLSSPGNI